jgi:hypothetical protein
MRISSILEKEFDMKRIIFVALAFALSAFVFVSCSSTPKIDKPVVSAEGKVTIIDDVYHLTRPTPEWIFLETMEIEKQGAYKDSYLFKFVQQGQDVDGLSLWVRGFAAASEIARMVSTRVQDTFVGAAAGDKDKLETYLEEVVKSVSSAQYSGAVQAAKYWWQIQKASVDGNLTQVYEYYLLYSVPKAQIDQAIKRALAEADGKAKPKSEDEQTARDRVKAAMEGGLD